MKVNSKEYTTIDIMAKDLGIEPNTVKQRLFRAGIKPVMKDALYELSAFKAISNVPGKGRPKKQPLAEDETPIDKPQKTKR